MVSWYATSRLQSAVSGASADAWMVDYNAALATICFMLFLGGWICQHARTVT